MDAYDDVERELDRVVDRLVSMPLAKAGQATDAVDAAATTLLEQTRALDPDIPADATLPALAPQGLGAQIAVLGRDWLHAARASSADPQVVLDALVTLRRALP